MSYCSNQAPKIGSQSSVFLVVYTRVVCNWLYVAVMKQLIVAGRALPVIHVQKAKNLYAVLEKAQNWCLTAFNTNSIA